MLARSRLLRINRSGGAGRPAFTTYAEAEFHWLQDMQQLGAPPSRHISVGNYSVTGNAVYLQGMEWGQQAPPAWMQQAPGMQAPFQCRLFVQAAPRISCSWPGPK